MKFKNLVYISQKTLRNCIAKIIVLKLQMGITTVYSENSMRHMSTLRGHNASSFSMYGNHCALGQWSSTRGTRASGVTQRHFKGYAKTSYGVCKIEKKYYFVIKNE